MRNDLKRASALAGMALMVLVAGCDRKADNPDDGVVVSDSSRQGQSMVRVVNAVPSTASVDVTTDDASTFSAVTFKTVTPYKTVRDNMVTFALRSAGSAPGDTVKPLAENREMLSDGDRYTIIALPGANPDDDPRLRVLEEPTDLGDPAKARLRFVNAAPGLATFDVQVPNNDGEFFDDVDFGTEAGFKDMDAATGAIVVRADDGGAVLLTLPERAYEPGKTYTVIITNRTPTGKQLEAIVVEDDVATVTAPTAGQ